MLLIGVATVTAVTAWTEPPSDATYGLLPGAVPAATVFGNHDFIIGVDCEQDERYYCQETCRESCFSRMNELSSIDECLEAMPRGCRVLLTGAQASDLTTDVRPINKFPPDEYDRLPMQAYMLDVRHVPFERIIASAEAGNVTYDHLHMGVFYSRPLNGATGICLRSGSAVYWTAGDYDSSESVKHAFVSTSAVLQDLQPGYQLIENGENPEWAAWLALGAYVPFNQFMHNTYGPIDKTVSTFVFGAQSWKIYDDLPSEWEGRIVLNDDMDPDIDDEDTGGLGFCFDELTSISTSLGQRIVFQWHAHALGRQLSSESPYGAPLPRRDAVCSPHETCDSCTTEAECTWCMTPAGELCTSDCQGDLFAPTSCGATSTTLYSSIPIMAALCLTLFFFS